LEDRRRVLVRLDRKGELHVNSAWESPFSSKFKGLLKAKRKMFLGREK
jgi:hypothetical protein